MQVRSKCQTWVSWSVMVCMASFLLLGCGESEGVAALSSWLKEFSKVVDNYESAVTADKTAKAEWDAKIVKMTTRWTELCNQYGDALTPQQMQKMVEEHDSLIAHLTEFKAHIGS